MQLKNINKDYFSYSLIVIIALIIIFITKSSNYLFGSEVDWFTQHAIFPEYFRQLFYQTGNVFPNFAFNIGAGQNIYNFAYYGLLSPIILFSYFLPFVKMMDYMIVSINICIISSALLFYWWLKNNNFSRKISLVSSLLFLLATPLLFHAHRQIMFVDYIPFLILGLIGIDKYFKRHKRWLFILSVFLMIMTSYFFSVGGLVVFVIYGVYKYLIINNKLNFKKIVIDALDFLYNIVVGIMMSAVLLLPVISVIIQNQFRAENVNNIFNLLIPNISLVNILYDPYSMGLTSIAVISLVALMLSKKREDWFLLLALGVIIFIPIFKFLLNGMLYIREKALIPFMPIIALIIAKFLKKFDEDDVKYKKFLLILILANIIFFISGYHTYVYYFEMILIILLYLVFYKLTDKKIAKNLFYVIIVCVGFSFAYAYNVDELYVEKTHYNDVYSSEKQELIDNIINQDKTFYRFNNLDDQLETINKIYNDKYYETSVFSSTPNTYYYNFYNNVFKNALQFTIDLNLSQTNNIMFQTFMDVKYIITKNDAPVGYRQIDSKNGVGLYVNENVFPIGFVNPYVISSDEFDKLEYPHNIETLLNRVVINGDSDNEFKSNIKEINLDYDEVVGKNITMTKQGDVTNISASEDDKLTLNLKEPLNNKILFFKFDLQRPKCDVRYIQISVNGIANGLTCEGWMYDNKNTSFEYVISSNLELSKLEMEFTKGDYKIENIKIYILDYDTIKNISSRFDKLVIDRDKTIGDKIFGKISVTQDGYFATTIPYDKGFQVYLNGKIQKYEKVNTAFLGFPIKKGDYDVRIEYHAPLSKEGMIVSMIGLILFILNIALRKHKSLTMD